MGNGYGQSNSKRYTHTSKSNSIALNKFKETKIKDNDLNMIPNVLMKALLAGTVSSVSLEKVLTSLVTSSLTNNNSKSRGHGKRHGKRRKAKTNNNLKLLSAQLPKTKTKKAKTKSTKKTKSSPDEIKKWFDLLKEGAITQEEYDKKKKELL